MLTVLMVLSVRRCYGVGKEDVVSSEIVVDLILIFGFPCGVLDLLVVVSRGNG